MTEAAELKRVTKVALRATEAMIRAAIDAVGDHGEDDDDWNNMVLSIATGMLLTSFGQIDEAIPRLAAETYLKGIRKRTAH